MGLCVWKGKRRRARAQGRTRFGGKGRRGGGVAACARSKEARWEQQDASLNKKTRLHFGGDALRAGGGQPTGANGITRFNEGVGPIWLHLNALIPVFSNAQLVLQVLSYPPPGRRGGEDEPDPGLLKCSCPATFLLAWSLFFLGGALSLSLLSVPKFAAQCSLRMSCNMPQPSCMQAAVILACGVCRYPFTSVAVDRLEGGSITSSMATPRQPKSNFLDKRSPYP